MNKSNKHHITSEQVHHVAALARFQITDQEAAQYAKELESILDWVDALGELDLTGVQPLVHATEQTNIMREDTPSQPLPVDDALKNAPESYEQFFKAPKILGDGSSA